ncbi:hypothetical protein [Roseiconus lacunae]|uniref:hypothetical protein n=1 Tax=Roseiconus lacunae TaxID=2605694 RepID=UPI001E524E27|nr:hypothetical protein [Roseiconus lacunae]MCD0460063.1 hypothetical protein [Roseiconus lacunae]
MSRASDLRQAIKSELETHFPSHSVDEFLIPRYERSELNDGPRIVVRSGTRGLSLNQGPDEVTNSVEVGVVGVPDPKSTPAQALAKFDEYDGLLEQIIALWINDGPLANAGVAEHFPIEIEQSNQFDVERLYSEGVYLSMIRITYRDSEDE